MTRLQTLLEQKEPLEKHEIADLREWLSEMEGDCEFFGPAPEDLARMSAIRARITAEST